MVSLETISFDHDWILWGVIKASRDKEFHIYAWDFSLQYFYLAPFSNVPEMPVFSWGWCQNVFEMKPGICDCHWIIDERIVLIYNTKDKFISVFAWFRVEIHFPVKLPVSVRISHRMCSIKTWFSKISQISQKNTCVVVSF